MVCKSIIFVVFVTLVVEYSLAAQSTSDNADSRWAELGQHKFRKGPPVRTPIEDREVYIRWPRSPQGRLEDRFENSDRPGSKGNVVYVHHINKDLDVYASGRRDIGRNNNSAHAVGFSWRF